MNDPIYHIQVPKSHVMFYMAAMGKFPLEHAIEPYKTLESEIVRNEAELREPKTKTD